MKKYFSLSAVLVLGLLCLFGAQTAAAQSAQESATRNADADAAMLYTYLRYGEPVPDSLIKSLGFRGTGYARTPSNFFNIVNAIAAQWIFGVSPEGVTSYDSSNVVKADQENNVYSQEEAQLFREVAEAALGTVPTDSEKLSSSDPKEQGKITSLEGDGSIVKIAFSDANSTGAFADLWSAAIGRAQNLAATAPDLNGMLPEQESSRQIGSTNNSVLGDLNANESVGNLAYSNNGKSAVAGTFTSRLSGKGTVLADATGAGNDSPFNIFKAKGGITVPAQLKTGQGLLLGALPAMMIASQPAGTSDTPVNENNPSSIYGSKVEKNVTSASVPGNARLLGTNNEVAGLTNKLPGASMANLQDAMNVALQNSADQINNQFNQLNNAQDHFPDGRLNQLQNQFNQEDFGNQMGNRFPGSGGNNGGGASPTATPTQATDAGCDMTKAVLSQQEVVDIADFLGLPISGSSWTVSYFKAQQMLGQSVYLGTATTKTTIDSSIIPDGQACVWVTYAPSAREGVYVSDVRSSNGTKFMFTVP